MYSLAEPLPLTSIPTTIHMMENNFVPTEYMYRWCGIDIYTYTHQYHDHRAKEYSADGKFGYGFMVSGLGLIMRYVGFILVVFEVCSHAFNLNY